MGRDEHSELKTRALQIIELKACGRSDEHWLEVARLSKFTCTVSWSD